MNLLFWQKHPALLYALSYLMGCYFALGGGWLSLLPLVMFLGTHYPFTKKGCIRITLAILTFFVSVIYVKTQYIWPTLPPQGAEGSIEFEIQSLSQSKTHFGKFWVYKGKIRNFYPKHPPLGQAGKNLPCRIKLPCKSENERPPANKSYLIEGKLVEQPNRQYIFIIHQEKAWRSLIGTWSLAEFRFQAKNALARKIRHYIQDPQPAVFLTGIATGDFDDRQMLYEFGRFGLQHIMAISGFHFSIISGIIGLVLGCIFSKRHAILFLICVLSLYFLFLGDSPSIMRSWMTVLIALVGFLIQKRHNGLNSLGIALLAILLYNPLLCLNIGFQFSFLATGGILLLFPSMDFCLQLIFPLRALGEMIRMNKLNQHGYFILCCFRQGLALSLAINLISMPLVLYSFHKFSAMSLLYNLFFPFLVSLSIFLLIMAGFLSFIPYLGQMLHNFNSHYTSFILNYTYNMPSTVDTIWRINELPTSGLIAYLCLILYLGVWLQQKLEERDVQEFVFM